MTILQHNSCKSTEILHTRNINNAKDMKILPKKLTGSNNLESLFLVEKEFHYALAPGLWFKHLLYISVSSGVDVQKTTALILSFCFSRNLRTFPGQ